MYSVGDYPWHRFDKAEMDTFQKQLGRTITIKEYFSFKKAVEKALKKERKRREEERERYEDEREEYRQYHEKYVAPWARKERAKLEKQMQALRKKQQKKKKQR